jgi:response regulator RpfG family c-di-GMP phosphodiesterase
MSTREVNIILIDDSDIDTSVNEKLIKLANITPSVETFNTAKEAVKYLINHADDLKSKINIILLDILMPESNGFDCLRKLEVLDEELQSSFRVYMLSSSIDRLDIMKADSEPMVRKVLEKPLDVYQLKRIVEELRLEFSNPKGKPKE